jgi:hypothetical protein
MIRAVQLISHPIAPVKNGIVISLIHSLVLTAGPLRQLPRRMALRGPYRG